MSQSPLRVLLVAIAFLANACRGGAASSAVDANGDVELPGVDTREFTTREKHEFSRYVREFAAPCPALAVPIDQCVLEKRPCAECLPAAVAVAKAVREGMAREQIEGLYKSR